MGDEMNNLICSICGKQKGFLLVGMKGFLVCPSCAENEYKEAAKLRRGAYIGCSIMIAAIILALVTLSCGVMTTIPVPGAISAPAPRVNMRPQVNTAEMVVCKSGGLNVRKSPAGDHDNKWKHDGDIVTVKLPATVTPDMGLWYELTTGGWVNGKFLCKE